MNKEQEKVNNKQENYQLLKSFIDSIDPVKDMAVDIGEVFLDSKLCEGALKELPLVSLVVSIAEFKTNIQRNIEILKLTKFLMRVAEGLGPNEEKQGLLEKIHEDQKKYDKALEHTLFIITQYSELEKADILGKFFVAFLEGKIDLEDFKLYAGVINQLFPNEIKYMENELFRGGKYAADIRNAYKSAVVQRLTSLGLCYEEIKVGSRLYGNEIGSSVYRDTRLTKFGQTFFRIALS